MSRLRKSILYISIVILSVCFTLIFSVLLDKMLDIGLHRIGYFKAIYPDVTLRFQTAEFNFEATISAQGLRNNFVTVPKPKDKIRILAIGDSFTFGWGVDLKDTWVKLLEKSLKERGLNVEIVNAGVPGIGLRAERWVCRAYAKKFETDAIIVGIYSDDLNQAAEQTLKTTALQQFATNTWPIISRIDRPIIEGSNFKLVGKNTVIDVDQIWKLKAGKMEQDLPDITKNLSPEVEEYFRKGLLNPALVERAYYFPQYLVFKLDPSLLNFSLTAFKLKADKFYERCGQDYPIMFVFFPGSAMVSSSYHSYKEALGFETDDDQTKINLDGPLSAVFKKENSTYVSLLSEFRSDGCPACYYPLDGHLSTYGNKRTADFLMPKVYEWIENIQKNTRH